MSYANCLYMATYWVDRDSWFGWNFVYSNEELVILNSWVQEFLYNLSDTIKVFSILLVTNLCIGFHLPPQLRTSDWICLQIL